MTDDVIGRCPHCGRNLTSDHKCAEGEDVKTASQFMAEALTINRKLIEIHPVFKGASPVGHALGSALAQLLTAGLSNAQILESVEIILPHARKMNDILNPPH